MSGKFIDAYSVLQIGPDSDDAAVRARHRELAKQFHPDRGGRAADGELMMRINRARDVLLDPVARATLDEELARRRRESTPPGPAGNGQATAPGTQPVNRDRRWRAEWGSGSPWAAPPAGSASSGPVPPPAAQVRPSANRLRHASRQARRANPEPNPALSARQRTAPPPPATEAPRRRPAKPQPAQPQPAQSQPAQPQPTQPQPAQPVQPQPAAPQSANPQQASPQPSAPTADRPATAWSLYAVPLDGVSVAALVASLIMCGPLGFILGIIGLARTADERRRGRWAAVAGIAISSLTMLLAIGYVMQAMSAPAP